VVLGKECVKVILQTCSGVISFSKELENESAKFYGNLCQKFGTSAEIYQLFIKENKRNIVDIERAYYGVISDAIEGCYAFNVDPDKYQLDTELSGITCDADAFQKARGVEEKIISFYQDAAEQSKSLMADVPRAFNIVAKKRIKRLSKLNIPPEAK